MSEENDKVRVIEHAIGSAWRLHLLAIAYAALLVLGAVLETPSGVWEERAPLVARVYGFCVLSAPYVLTITGLLTALYLRQAVNIARTMKERCLIATAAILTMPINGFHKGEWWVSLCSVTVTVFPPLLYIGLALLGQPLSFIGLGLCVGAYLFCLYQRQMLLIAQNSNFLQDRISELVSMAQIVTGSGKNEDAS
ncbi:hypothetical protein PsAD5_01368 [Pseudovibrio sp. Ad5]|uniref:hypothetical protein n=1 Tax=Pseudovibrio sp. Ad5 TaxID=989436 RepID=UPI0007B2CD0D|nr:hypothetical protein [Pseudovibrio sp. Ad5]KZK99535.1 hypothetical protein PsAD5_01368 [Pseudovibrio sp. Ad5]